MSQPELNFRTNRFDSLPRRERHIFLVHGYHTPEEKARKMYDRFVTDFGPDARSLMDDAVYVFWPGDETFRPLSGLCYLWKIPQAKAVGRQFAAYLNALRGPLDTPCEIILIAHSLGCRLVLEACKSLAQLEPRAGHRIRLILMAAAVPVALVDRQGYLRPAIGDVAQAVVFYSESDEVLGSWKFRLAESSEGLMLPEAVGLHGRPGAAVWSALKRAAGHKHRDYWSKGHASSVTARLLGASIALPVSARPGSAARTVAPWPDPPARPGPPFRAGFRA